MELLLVDYSTDLWEEHCPTRAVAQPEDRNTLV